VVDTLSVSVAMRCVFENVVAKVGGQEYNVEKVVRMPLFFASNSLQILKAVSRPPIRAL